MFKKKKSLTLTLLESKQKTNKKYNKQTVIETLDRSTFNAFHVQITEWFQALNSYKVVYDPVK